ncbi:MAG: transposase [Nostoc sp.]|uniref:transposase n=1 Tax=Nostoc sp. TaxID=1180 RepID=UPI002FFCED51
MTPNKNDCILKQFIFEQVKSCPVVVNFNGEPVTSDAGLTLVAELDRKREITSRLVACFKNYREQNKILHPVNGLIAQRIYGLIMGYEDVNDHETLRHDAREHLTFANIGIIWGKIVTMTILRQVQLL